MSGNKDGSTKNVLLAHSRAKVDLLKRYLAVYLNILSRWRSLDEIFIFDLMCGEGVYRNGFEGSPIAILKTIKTHYFANDKTCPKITVWLNDPGQSDIEPESKKIDRVYRFCEPIFQPRSVRVEYFDQDWRDLLLPALSLAHAHPS